jgi:hypothetical protein
MMKNRLDSVLKSIEQKYRSTIRKRSHHYLEVSIGKTADALGYGDLRDSFANTCVIVPLNAPQPGMKVLIDGRTFVDYAEFESGIAVPGYVARKAGRPFKLFVPEESMICNFA